MLVKPVKAVLRIYDILVWIRIRGSMPLTSVADAVPDPHVFGPPGSGSISQRYGSGSFFHQAKIIRKTLIPTAL
jgi:hypothetical protein